MRTIKVLIYILVVSIFLSACSSPNSTDSTQNIKAPKNNSIPIKGIWEISSVLNLTGESLNEEEDSNKWLDKKVQFSNQRMSFIDTTIENPRYQIKRVASEDYILFNSKTLPPNFSFNKEYVEVLTIIDEDKFFCEVLIVEEDKLILKIQGNNFYLRKVSSEIDQDIFSENINEGSNGLFISINENTPKKTGLLLGIRSKNTDDLDKNQGEYSYKTLWISVRDNAVDPILTMDNIFFPRRSGFWRINTNKARQDDRLEEYIVANNILMEEDGEDQNKENEDVEDSQDTENIVKLDTRIAAIRELETLESLEELKELEDLEDNIDLTSESDIDFSRWGDRLGEIKRRIDYVGNDYIAVEAVGEGEYELENGIWKKSKLQVLPIDSLPNGQEIKISDILDEDGIIGLRAAWERAVNSLEIDSRNILYRGELLENFGLERKLGHWFIKGRINYMLGDEFNVHDYDVSLMPPSEVVTFDSLLVPWTNIKDVVPSATDAYTSPNKDIALVFTEHELLIYDIYGNELNRLPKERISLNEEDTVVMVEWASGQYVERWKEVFLNSGGEILDYKGETF